MLRFKKMDCWQECNFPFSKSPIGFHTLQGFSRYTREIQRRSLGMELLTFLQIQAYLRLWTLPKVTLFLNPHPLGWDIAIQQNMTVFLWQEALPSWHVWLMGPPTHQHTMQDGWCVDRKQFLVVFLSHPSQGDPALTPVVPSPSWEKPQRGTQQQPHQFLEESSRKYNCGRRHHFTFVSETS